jgi:HSP20 family protein
MESSQFIRPIKRGEEVNASVKVNNIRSRCKFGEMPGKIERRKFRERNSVESGFGEGVVSGRKRVSQRRVSKLFHPCAAKGVAEMADKPKRPDQNRETGGFGVRGAYIHSQDLMFSLETGVWTPPADVFETANEITIRMEIAGLSKDDFSLSVERNRLIIQGQRQDMEHAPMTCLHQVEVRYGRFKRAFDLPAQVQVGDIQAQYDRGFLIVRLSKNQEPPKRIEVKVEHE